MADGSILLVEIDRGTLSRVRAGTTEVVAYCGGGPNGLAIGPDGAAYICNNGGVLPHYSGGRIERIDLESSEVQILYREYDGEQLSAPNDLVFDDKGGFWFTDSGARRRRSRDYGRIFYAKVDGSELRLVLDRVSLPNGIGLSPDGDTLYFVETYSARLYRRTITGMGEVEHARVDDPETLLCGLPGLQWFDSLAIDSSGNICIATMHSGCITAVSPNGSTVRQFLLPPHAYDPLPTNICFEGTEEQRAYITLSSTGRLARCAWST